MSESKGAIAYVITLKKDTSHPCFLCKKPITTKNKCAIIFGNVYCQYCSVGLGVNITYQDGIFSKPLNPNAFGSSQIKDVKYIS